MKCHSCSPSLAGGIPLVLLLDVLGCLGVLGVLGVDVELYYSFTPTANAESWAVEAFSLCMFFYLLPNSPSGPPWNEGHRPKVHHETSVFEVPVQEQHEHSFYSSSTNTFITGSLYTVHECRTSPGAPDLWARLG